MCGCYGLAFVLVLLFFNKHVGAGSPDPAQDVPSAAPVPVPVRQPTIARSNSALTTIMNSGVNSVGKAVRKPAVKAE